MPEKDKNRATSTLKVNESNDVSFKIETTETTENYGENNEHDIKKSVKDMTGILENHNDNIDLIVLLNRADIEQNRQDLDGIIKNPIDVTEDLTNIEEIGDKSNDCTDITKNKSDRVDPNVKNIGSTSQDIINKNITPIAILQDVIVRVKTDHKQINESAVDSQIRNVEFFCECCGMRFTDIKSLCLHVKDRSLPNHSFSCRICEAKSLRPISDHLSDHYQKKHDLDIVIKIEDAQEEVYPTAKNFWCLWCGLPFSNFFTMLNHKESHSNKSNLSCFECEEECNNLVALLQHVATTHPLPSAERVACELCVPSKMLSSIRDYQAHVKAKHMPKSEISFAKTIFCEFCGLKFETIRSLFNHLDTTNDNHSVNCVLCEEEIYGFPSERRRHYFNSHTYEECIEAETLQSYKFPNKYRIFCSVCGKSFSKINDYFSHYNHDHDLNRFPCSECTVESVCKVVKAAIHHFFNAHYAQKICEDGLIFCSECPQKIFNTHKNFADHKLKKHTLEKISIPLRKILAIKPRERKGLELKPLNTVDSQTLKTTALQKKQAITSQNLNTVDLQKKKAADSQQKITLDSKRRNIFDLQKEIALDPQKEKQNEGKPKEILKKQNNVFCEICGASFNNLKFFVEHLRNMPPHEHAYHCELCRKNVGPFAVGLEDHYDKCHANSKTNYFCYNCGKKFGNLFAYLFHSKSHDDTLLTCSECDEVFSGILTLTHHFGEKHTGCALLVKNNISCSKCRTLTFPDERAYLMHRAQKHFFPRAFEFLTDDLIAKNKKLICKICNTSFLTELGLAHHYKLHTDPQNVTNTEQNKCTVCSKTFSCKAELVCHVKTHPKLNKKKKNKRRLTAEKLYKCDTCSNSFIRKLDFEHHLVNCGKFKGNKNKKLATSNQAQGISTLTKPWLASQGSSSKPKMASGTSRSNKSASNTANPYNTGRSKIYGPKTQRNLAQNIPSSFSESRRDFDNLYSRNYSHPTFPVVGEIPRRSGSYYNQASSSSGVRYEDNQVASAITPDLSRNRRSWSPQQRDLAELRYMVSEEIKSYGFNVREDEKSLKPLHAILEEHLDNRLALPPFRQTDLMRDRYEQRSHHNIEEVQRYSNLHRQSRESLNLDRLQERDLDRHQHIIQEEQRRLDTLPPVRYPGVHYSDSKQDNEESKNRKLFY